MVGKAGFSSTELYDFSKRDEENEVSKSANPVGRQPALTEKGKRALGILIKKDGRATLAEVKKNCADQVSKSAIRNALQEEGLFNRIVKERPYFRIEHVRNRRVFAHEYKRWTLEDWRNIIWTYETSFELEMAIHQIKIWHTCTGAYQQKYFAPTFDTTRTLAMV